jgi:hypothetical protein
MNWVSRSSMVKGENHILLGDLGAPTAVPLVPAVHL